MLRYFRALGDRCEAAWRARDYDLAIFPRLAEELLNDSPAHLEVDPAALLEAVISTRDIVNEGSSDDFAQPSLPLYRSPRFHIEALFWFTATTAIHQHCFRGAFQVLSGSSVHGRHLFTPRTRYERRLISGDLRLERIELLERGYTRQIRPGTELVHSLFHLDHPSTTVVLRTHAEKALYPQLTYLPPLLAVDGHLVERSLELRTRALLAAAKMQPARLDELTARALDGGEPLALLYFLRTYDLLQPDAHARTRFFARMTERHGTLVDEIEQVLTVQATIKHVYELRATVREVGLRYFLALLLNCRTRAQLLELVSVRSAEPPPSRQVVAWLRELAKALPIPGDSTELDEALAAPWASGLAPPLRSLLSRVLA